MNAKPPSEVKPAARDEGRSARIDPIRRRFRRIAGLYLVASLAVLIAAAAAIRGDLPSINVQLVVVMAIYWLLPLPILRVLLDWRRLGRKAVFGTATTLILIVGLLELAGLFFQIERAYRDFHAGGIASRDLHHVMPADTVQTMSDHEGGEVLVRTNEDGFRTDYSREEFLAFDHRIVMMGDSFTFGCFVAQEDAIPDQLEDMLREARPDDSIAVLNAGVISYSPLIHRQVFKKKVAAYKPQLTIVCLDMTDIGDDIRYGRENIGSDDEPDFGFPEAWTNPEEKTHWKSMTMQVLRKTRLTFPLECLTGDFNCTVDRNLHYDYYDFDLEVDGRMEHNRFFIMRHPLSATRPFFENSYRHVQALHELCKENGSAFMLVLIPRYFHWNDKEVPDNWERNINHYRGDETYRFVFLDFFEQRAAEDHVRLLNLLPAFKQAKVFPLCHRDDPHFNRAGCRVAASAILDYLCKERLIDPASPQSLTPTSGKSDANRP